MQEYRRNLNVMPSGIRENLLFLQAWQRFFKGDSFTYEYYFMWDHYLDPGYYITAQILHADVQKLYRMGLNGLMSDQTQRAYFPTAFGMQVLVRTLWDPTIGFDRLAEEYFHSDFGEDGTLVQEYLAQLSELFNPSYLRGDYDQRDERSHVWVLNSQDVSLNAQAARKLAEIPAIVDQFRPVIERHLVDVDACRAKSWRILAAHAEIAADLARAFEARALGKIELARAYWERVQIFVQQHGINLHDVLDVFEFITVLGAKFPKNE